MFLTNSMIMNLDIKYLGYVVGFVFGMYTFEILQDADTEPRFVSEKIVQVPSIDKASYGLWLENKGYVLSKIDQDEVSFGKKSSELKKNLESRLLFDSIHVTCVVFVKKTESAYMVANTWGRRCNRLLFYTNNATKLSYMDVHIIPVKNSWQFMCECIRHLWLTNKHLQWVIFSFDDIYVIPENLRYFVASKNYKEPHYYGHSVYFWNVLYNSDKSGVVLSKGAIRAIVNKFSNYSSCEKSGRYMNNADYYLGKYLMELNITAGNTRDDKGKERFHIIKLEILLASDSERIVEKYTKKSVWPVKVGKDCCSDTSISFPTSGENLLTHYLLYQVKVFHSGKLGNRSKNETDNPESWKETALEEFGPNISLSEITASKYFELWEEKVKEVERKKYII